MAIGVNHGSVKVRVIMLPMVERGNGGVGGDYPSAVPASIMLWHTCLPSCKCAPRSECLCSHLVARQLQFLPIYKRLLKDKQRGLVKKVLK